LRAEISGAGLRETRDLLVKQPMMRSHDIEGGSQAAPTPRLALVSAEQIEQICRSRERRGR
jgi:hypothetical protein